MAAGKQVDDDRTVLIVDDDETWRELICSALPENWHVRVASNGPDAVAMTRRSQPDLIFLDVMMPGGMHGFDVLCELHKDPVTRDVPVILCTEINAVMGLGFTPDEMETYLGVQPAAMLEKPVSPARLLETAMRVIRDADTSSE